MAECPRCLRLQKTTPPRTPLLCGRCTRWQFAEQPDWSGGIGGAKSRHLACVKCGQGAWCRDLVVEHGIDADHCAYKAHVHPKGACSAAH